MSTPFTPVDTNEALVALLEQLPAYQLLDVRTPEEYEQLGHLQGALNLPVQTLAHTLAAANLNPQLPTVCVCQGGVRSAYACDILTQAGFTQLYNLSQGMKVWDGEVQYGPAL